MIIQGTGTVSKDSGGNILARYVLTITRLRRVSNHDDIVVWSVCFATMLA